jgi:hypothetical protein
MSSGVPADREAITAALDRFEAAQAEVAALSFDALTAPEALTAKDRLETVYRRQAAVDHRLTPGCTVAGANCQVHHAISDWAADGQTNVDDVTLACPKENCMVRPGGWTTRKRKDGRTEWIPPPHLDSGQSRVNDYHHPRELPTTR